jgi:integrase
LVQRHLDVFRSLRPGAATSRYLFPSDHPGDGHISPAQLSGRVIRELNVRLGTHFTVHDFRHFAATLAVLSGPNGMALAQSLLRHKSSQVTARTYGIMRQSAAASAWADVVGKAARGELKNALFSDAKTRAKKGKPKKGGPKK